MQLQRGIAFSSSIFCTFLSFMYFRDGWLGLRRWLDGQKTYSTNSTRLEDQYDDPDYVMTIMTLIMAMMMMMMAMTNLMRMEIILSQLYSERVMIIDKRDVESLF